MRQKTQNKNSHSTPCLDQTIKICAAQPVEPTTNHIDFQAMPCKLTNDDSVQSAEVKHREVSLTENDSGGGGIRSEDAPQVQEKSESSGGDISDCNYEDADDKNGPYGS